MLADETLDDRAPLVDACRCNAGDSAHERGGPLCGAHQLAVAFVSGFHAVVAEDGEPVDLEPEGLDDLEPDERRTMLRAFEKALRVTRPALDPGTST